LVGGPISVSLMQLEGTLGLAGWQWMFIIEGLPAVVLGFLCLKILSDTPEQAAWLTPVERQSLVGALASEVHERPKKDLLAAMKDARVLLSALIVFCYTVGSYGLSVWLPLILKGHDLSTSTIGWLSAIPFLFATLSTFAVAHFADKTGLKIYALIFTLMLGVFGLLMSVYFQSLISAMLWFTISLCGVISARMIFYTVPQVFLTGAAAAGGLAFINSVGSLGGFVGPSMMGWLKDATKSYDVGMLGMACILVIAITATIALKGLVKNA
ncbi:membrane protein, partial [Bradyrhizobium sp. NAS80.1]|uniref:MFS transporter n=1 Tax=Bradyrhizobium sp. NAS80.1 TaxID=1680159 RepID=UPI00095EA2C8